VIGKGKTTVYVALVTLFSTLSGLLFGAWVDGSNAWWIVGGSVAGVIALAALVTLIEGWVRQRRELATDRRSAV
jgi:hypothetical protein